MNSASKYHYSGKETARKLQIKFIGFKKKNFFYKNEILRIPYPSKVEIPFFSRSESLTNNHYQNSSFNGHELLALYYFAQVS